MNHARADYRDMHLKPEFDQFQNFRYRFSSVEAQVRRGVVWAAFCCELIADTSSYEGGCLACSAAAGTTNLRGRRSTSSMALSWRAKEAAVKMNMKQAVDSGSALASGSW